MLIDERLTPQKQRKTMAKITYNIFPLIITTVADAFAKYLHKNNSLRALLILQNDGLPSPIVHTIVPLFIIVNLIM